MGCISSEKLKNDRRSELSDEMQHIVEDILKLFEQKFEKSSIIGSTKYELDLQERFQKLCYSHNAKKLQ